MNTVIPGLLIACALGGLLFMAAREGAIPELQVRDLLAQAEAGTLKPGQGQVKVHGIISAIEQDHRPLIFSIRDKQNADQVITVEIDSARPDIFDLDKEVAVIVDYAGASRLKGDKIFTKCPSKYEAAGEAGAAAASKSYKETSPTPVSTPE